MRLTLLRQNSQAKSPLGSGAIEFFQTISFRQFSGDIGPASVTGRVRALSVNARIGGLGRHLTDTGICSGIRRCQRVSVNSGEKARSARGISVIFGAEQLAKMPFFQLNAL